MTQKWQAKEQRDQLVAWVEGALSEGGRDYRITALSKAFGLGEHIIRGLLEPPELMDGYLAFRHGCGPMLMREILLWCAEHPDIGQNNPIGDDDLTFFAHLKID